jgi:DNA-binding NarL/FixJ family response regulator
MIQPIAQGLTNHQIARLLGISPRTVGIHRAKTIGRLHLKNSPALVRYAMFNGLLDAPPYSTATAHASPPA